MKRRDFIKKSTATASALSIGVTGLHALQNSKNTVSKHKFKLKYAPHLGMFKTHAGDDPIDQLHFIADQGFTAFEDNGIKNRPIDIQKKMAKTMASRKITMGVFVAHKIYWKEPNLASGNQIKRQEFLNQIKSSIEVAKRVNAKWMTVVPGHVDLSQNKDYQTTHVIESLKQASAILEPHNLTMVLEPLNYRNHPGLFLTGSLQAYQICKAVDSPACKILFDIYHQQIQEGNLIPNIDTCWDEIAYFQIGDNPGRNEPTTGEINYKNVFKFIHNKGYNGILGMEHGNSINGKEGEIKVIEAYKASDNF
ncbi:hydroxypyruvate isomerase family protein [Aestuariivivens marinum]|uniref:hydroxypyruvate isomerase family protein n=1 Tax=Aestuariivivens marinum TaxID=2913555 RepID=UPI001F570A77|nr:TIM barrel protein [Aestuariivivens marinum]